MIAQQNHFVSLMGKVSTKVIGQLHLTKPSGNKFWAFVDYAQRSYRAGARFDFMTNDRQDWNSDCILQILEIRDQFNNQPNSVLKGWQTMCFFECSPAIPEIIDELPEMDSWVVSDKAIYVYQQSKASVSMITPIIGGLIDDYGNYILAQLTRKNVSHFNVKDVEVVVKRNFSTSKKSQRTLVQLVMRRLTSRGLLRKKGDELEVVKSTI
jgi:hypothetical protein